MNRKKLAGWGAGFGTGVALLVVLLALLLPILTPATESESSRSAEAGTECSFSDWIGNPVDEGAVKNTGRPYRILPPDAMMTMDFNPERINIHTNEEGIVQKVRCG